MEKTTFASGIGMWAKREWGLMSNGYLAAAVTTQDLVGDQQARINLEHGC